LNKSLLYKGHIFTFSPIKSTILYVNFLLISLILLIDIEEKVIMVDAYAVPNQGISNVQTEFHSQSITNSPGSTRSSQFSENTAINSYNQLEEYSSSNVNQVISGGQYTNQLQELKNLHNSLNNQFTTNMKSSQIIDPTADDNILTTILQENSGNQLIKQIQKVNLGSQSNNQHITENDKQNQAFIDKNLDILLLQSSIESQAISQDQNILQSLLNELRSQENLNNAINSYVPFAVNNNDISNIDLFKYISQANIAQDQCTSDPNCFLHGKNDVLIEAAEEEEGENNKFSNKIGKENLKTSTCEGMKECNTIEIGIGNILAEIENSFNVIVNQRLQQYNECNANSKCENIATIYGNIENSNNIELNENLIQNNFCTFGSNCMNIGTISSETLMEEAKTIVLELTQENKCKNQATCINEFNMNDLDTISNYQENICIGGTCINTGINSKIISNHADCLNSGIDTTMICNKKVQITKSPEKISVSKTVLESKD
jgi:hypothetical protein